LPEITNIGPGLFEYKIK